MFIVALFTIVKMWNQPQCLSTNEWINKIWDVRTMEYHSDIKRDGVLTWARTWMDLQNSTPRARSQTQKATCVGSRFYEMSRTGTSAETARA